MGACASAEERAAAAPRAAAAAAPDASGSPCAAHVARNGGGAPHGAAAAAGGRVLPLSSAWPEPPPPQPQRGREALGGLSSQYAAGAKSRSLLRDMASLSAHALVALPHVADLIASHAGADVVSIAAFVESDAECAVALATSGPAAAALGGARVMRGPEWSAAVACDALWGRLSIPDAAAAEERLPRDIELLHTQAGLRCFEVVAIAPAGGPPLGALLVARAAPRSLGAGADGGPSPLIEEAATGLLLLLRQACVQQAAAVVLRAAEAPDLVAAISTLLQGATQFMWRAANSAMVLRLALLPDGPESSEALVFESASAGDAARRKQDGGGSGSSRSIRLPSGPAADVSVRRLPLGRREGRGGGTLLEKAFAAQRTVTVQDTATYVQNSRCPPRDLFSQSAAAAGVAVVPMYFDGSRLGAVYFSPTAPLDFDNVSDTLMGIVPCATQALAHHLRRGSGSLQALSREASQSLEARSFGYPGSAHRLSALHNTSDRSCIRFADADAGPAGASPPAAAHAHSLALAPRGARGGGDGSAHGLANGSSGNLDGSNRGADHRPAVTGTEEGSSEDARQMWNMSGSLEDVLPLGPPLQPVDSGLSLSSKLEVVAEKSLSTESMMKVLQREIRRGRRCSMELSFMSDLTLVKEIGRGGYGTVYSGFWRRGPAAIKVMDSRAHDGEAVSDAMEMAVLSSVQHPNIVQLYACLLGMVAAADEGIQTTRSMAISENGEALAPAGAAGAAGTPAPGARPRRARPPCFRRLAPGEGLAPDVQTYNLVVMELCDRGSLADAVAAGAFHSRGEGEEPRPDLGLVVQTLLDVATSLQYLHDSANLVHGDVKLDNILLKSDPLHPGGFIPKLSDFGLTKVLDRETGKRVFNVVATGTVTHLAPELLIEGSEITPGVDVYAFGVLMWELYTGRRAFEGLSSGEVMSRVIQQIRPVFPHGTPPAYAILAGRCWLRAPGHRPAFSDIVLSLRAMRDHQEEERAAAAAAAATAARAANAAASPAAPPPGTPGRDEGPDARPPPVPPALQGAGGAGGGRAPAARANRSL